MLSPVRIFLQSQRKATQLYLTVHLSQGFGEEGKGLKSEHNQSCLLLTAAQLKERNFFICENKHKLVSATRSDGGTKEGTRACFS